MLQRRGIGGLLIVAFMGTVTVAQPGCGLDDRGTRSSEGGGTTSSSSGAGGSGGSDAGVGGAGGGSAKCTEGEQQPCYTGKAGTANVGSCKSGTQTCDADGLWGACEGEVLPSDEFCDGLDTDCDGLDDLDPAVGCSAYRIQGEMCFGALLRDDQGAIVPSGSTPDQGTCSSVDIQGFVDSFYGLYVLDNDPSLVVDTIGIVGPMNIVARTQPPGVAYSHVSLGQQVDGGGFSSMGITDTTMVLPDGWTRHMITNSAGGQRYGSLFSF